MVRVFCRAQQHVDLPAHLIASLPCEKVRSSNPPASLEYRVLKRDLGPLLQQLRLTERLLPTSYVHISSVIQLSPITCARALSLAC